MTEDPILTVLQKGDTTKTNPFTVAIVSNPALETPWNSGTFVVDPITSDQPAFDVCAQAIIDALFGLLPGQQERFIADPAIAPYIRVISLFISGLPAISPNSLAAQDGMSTMLIARRSVFNAFLAQYGYQADIVYAVSASATHNRASAWFTSDDDTQSGVGFQLDGLPLTHRYYYQIPGTVALHSTSGSITPLHEFGHALSSYTNGSIVDLYVDGAAGVNNKQGRPIPPTFGSYQGAILASDMSRDSLGYPAGWQSYHSELLDPVFPAVMDDYWSASSAVPQDCQHDRITRQFLRDRLAAKIARP